MIGCTAATYLCIDINYIRLPRKSELLLSRGTTMASSVGSALTGKNLRPEKVRGWPLVARKEKKSDVNYHFSPTETPTIAQTLSGSNVAAIDFGTTHCSIAYTTAAADETSSLKLNDYYTRVPTAILFKKGKEISHDGSGVGVECTIDSFGYNAQDKYQRLKRRENANYLYFERMKMRLQHDKVSF